MVVSLDNYFVDRHHTPKDETGDYDYESLFALDLELFNDHLNRLIRGERIELPYYNFERGEREYRQESICLDDNSILLIEGIHGLNPELTRDVAPERENQNFERPTKPGGDHRQPSASPNHTRL